MKQEIHGKSLCLYVIYAIVEKAIVYKEDFL